MSVGLDPSDPVAVTLDADVETSVEDDQERPSADSSKPVREMNKLSNYTVSRDNFLLSSSARYD
jgi:hypothetical protein